jgi:prepilin-type N-terminal cleavage/methylation domain-containing protein
MEVGMGIAHVSIAMFRSTFTRRNRGFSLIELVVVMGIMAALALVAIPWFTKISQRSALKSAAREVQTTLLAARMKAVKRNQNVSVAITPGPPVVLAIVEPQPPAPTPTSAPQYLALPPRSAFMYSTPIAPSGVIPFAGDGRIPLVVTPLATPGAYEYVLRGPVGVATPNEVKVQVWPNGRVVVVTPTDWY